MTDSCTSVSLNFTQNELERMQLRETVKSYRSEIEAAEQIVAAETEAMKKAHAEEVRKMNFTCPCV